MKPIARNQWRYCLLFIATALLLPIGLQAADKKSGPDGPDATAETAKEAIKAEAHKTAKAVKTAGSVKATQPVPAATAPANDNFANAIALSGGRIISTSGTTAGATTQAGEPYSGYHTVWWKWTAPADTFVEVDTRGSAVNNVLSVYQAATSPVALNRLENLGRTYAYPIFGDGTEFNGSFRFVATSGRTYYISVGDFIYNGTASGNVSLSLETPAPNDNFASATNLGSNGTQSVTGDNYVATGEPGENTAYANTKDSVWWKWQPTTGGTVEVIDTAGSHVDTTLEVFTGTSINSLTRIRKSNNVYSVNLNYHPDADYTSRVAFPVTASTVYYIRVGGLAPDQIYTEGRPPGEGTINLDLHSYPAPSTAADHILWGRAYLEEATSNGLTQADAQFAQALSIDSSNGEANVLQALTKLALLQLQPAYPQLLTQIGLTNKTDNLLRTNLSIPKDSQGIPIPTQTSNSSQVIAYLQQQVVPLLSTLDAELAKITDPAFEIRLTDSESSLRDISIDYTDVQLLRASFQAIRAAAYFADSYNLAASLSTISSQVRAKSLSAKSVKQTFGSLLKFNTVDHRSDLSNAFKLANQYYQVGSSNALQRANPIDHRHLFPLPSTPNRELNFRENVSDVSNSLGGEINWEGTHRINLSKLITTSVSLHDMLANLQGNQVIANTAPDPTFAGAVPDGTQQQVNDVLHAHGLLYDVSTYASWAAQLLPGLTPAQQAPDANPSGDGLTNRFKYAFGLDPSKLAVSTDYIVQDLLKDTGTGKKYLSITFARRIDTTAVTYVIALSNDLKTWDRSQTQVVQVGNPVPNDDGITESVTVRATADLSVTSKQFVRVEATVAIP